MNKKRIAVTGSSGLVGSHLVSKLEAGGAEVLRLTRRQPAAANEVFWDPAGGQIDASQLEGVDAVVHLAGVSIAGKRWNAARRQQILDSRVQGTALLARTLAELDRKPAVLLSTSAVGYYGNSGATLLTEQSPQGAGFLADVCAQWEAAANPARAAGIRVVHPRFGVVLSADGGMLPPIARLFRFGLGGRIGKGKQYFSWIELNDLLRILSFLIETDTLEGPVNAVGPETVTNSEFTTALGRVLSRPTMLPAPEFAIRAIMGQMGEELVLASQRCVPARLDAAGFRFESPTIEAALGHALHPASQPAARTVPAMSGAAKR